MTRKVFCIFILFAFSINAQDTSNTVIIRGQITDSNNLPIQNEAITISDSDKIENGIDILFTNSNHSIGNILTSYIYNLNLTNISYIAYKMVHPLKKEMLITVGLNDTEDKINNIKNIFENLSNIFIKMDINTFRNI